MKKNENKESAESNFTKFLKAPLRFLVMARDAYVQSITSCSIGLVHGGGSGGGFGLPACNFHVSTTTTTGLPRCFSLNSSPPETVRHHGLDDKNYRELIRFASARTRGGSLANTRRRAPGLGVRRDYSSLVIGRIDEEKPCDFGDEDLTFEKRKSFG